MGGVLTETRVHNSFVNVADTIVYSQKQGCRYDVLFIPGDELDDNDDDDDDDDADNDDDDDDDADDVVYNS